MMARRMSCSLTVDAVRDQTKTVTRRHVDTWRTLKPGDRLTLIEKGMGLRKGERQKVLADVEIIEVHVEPIGAVTSNDVLREGFADMTPIDFAVFWLKAHGYLTHFSVLPGLPPRPNLGQGCRRIEFRYIRATCPECRNQFEGRMPGHFYGSNWDWVPCQTCDGVGLIEVAS